MRFLWNNHQHMKHFVIILLSLLTSFDVFAADSLKVIYRIRLDQDIDKSSQRLVTLGLEKALEADSDCILLDLDTYGGAVDAADSIRSAILWENILFSWVSFTMSLSNSFSHSYFSMELFLRLH